MRFEAVDGSLVAMADRKIFSRYNMRCGLILRAKEADVKLTGFTLPQIDQSFLVLTGKEIIGNNLVTMLGGRMPLLAIDRIEYIGQPLLAVFGPDYEAVELLMDKIEVNTEPYTKTEEEISLENTIAPLSFSWGQEEIPDENSLKQLKKFESVFKYSHTTISSPIRYNISVWQEGNNIHIESPMLWQELIRTTVATALGKEPRNIILHPQKHQNKHDEYLFYPAIYSTLAAIAMLLTGLPVELRLVGETARPGISIQRTTYLNEEHHPIVENVKMTVDQGAFCFASEEYQRQAMAGLMPLYTVKSFKADVEIVKSSKNPASFCGSLGYSEALAGTQYHTSMLANKTGYTPVQIRDELKREKTKFTDFAPAYNLEDKKEMLLHLAKISVFNRKWASNSFFSGDFGLLGALRGIGVATGLGIAGFSTTLSKQENFSALLNYTPKKNITINTSAPLSSSEIRYCKQLVSSKFNNNTDSDSVLFLEQNAETLDSGPAVLNRFESIFPSQLAIASKHLGTLLDKAKPPFSLKFNTDNIFSPCEFEYSGYGAFVVEIEIRKYDFIPLVKEAWGSFVIGKSFADDNANDIAKETILDTLRECGAVISKDFKLSLDITQTDGDEEGFTPINTIARGITMSAFSSALFQAAGPEASYLPTDASKLESIINGGGKP